VTSMKHIVGISGGKDSVCLALALKEKEPRDYEYLITPVGNELPEMREHWLRLEGLLGKPLTRLQPFGSIDGLRHLIEKYRGLPNHRQRWCTRELKILPTIAYLKANAPCVQYVGLRADEEERQGIYGDVPGVTQRYPLREWGMDIEDVWRFLADRGIKIPARTDCAWCYGQRIIEWKRLWEQHPDLYEEAIKMEELTGHTFRSPNRDTWPAPLTLLREEFRAGRKVRGERVELEQYQNDQEACRVCRL
jgi:hypothetical protein